MEMDQLVIINVIISELFNINTKSIILSCIYSYYCIIIVYVSVKNTHFLFFFFFSFSLPLKKCQYI